ncbi:BatA domain-containing protein [Spirosoma utsteinense]|uniref:Aerotolerance regulator N-terminal domain-containing protein n=1 Tax=Spirosoma utsteinense TaxID=2585773 RepID=A0ABR6W5M5_9BACT|nr:BatA domain-containing protein [Spirosoma utsteinense]MBC3786276.1 hypothetical protein [Spirosoma utsteinense]MBC3791902.1 hypothetical protein [Spirosoma utsteinense]
MTFIEPFLLWGALAVVIPIAIHFWHQKRGRLLPWAATQWLTEKNQQQSRGLRLDNILLLVLRCLLVLLLTILLARPVLNLFKKETTIQRIHLVQPNALVSANFRFELDEALRKGEKAYWLRETPEPFDTPAGASQLGEQAAELSPLTLQTAIDKLPSENTELHLYLINSQALGDVPAITVPARFRLHSLIDSAGKPRPFLALSNGNRLFIDQTGKLTSSATPASGSLLQTTPVHSGPIRVLLAYQTTAERQTVRAALSALSQVYAMPLSIEEKQRNDVTYDWILTDQLRPDSELARNPKTLYTISGTSATSTRGYVVFSTDLLSPQTSERVAGGQLPEWLGEQLIQHYGLETNQVPLSHQALVARFVPTTRHAPSQQATVQNLLLLLLIGILIVERWLALTKNA